MDSDQDTGQDTGQDVGGLPIAAAAGRLGLSVEAVRKRARRGSLHAYKRDGQWWDQSALLEALRQLEKIREENRNLAGQVGYMQAQLLQRDEVIRALQAPQDPPQPAQDAQEGPFSRSAVEMSLHRPNPRTPGLASGRAYALPCTADAGGQAHRRGRRPTGRLV